MVYPDADEYMREIGLNPDRWNNRVIVVEALARGLTIVRRKRGFLIRHPDGREYSWSGGLTSFNSRLSQRVTLHKDVCSRLLTACGVAATENAVFMEDEPDRAWQWAEKFELLVVKPTDGARGHHVHTAVKTRDEFLASFHDVSQASAGRVLVEEFYTGVEHRCLVVDGRFVAGVRRRPASVLGDGESTVEDLVAEKNKNRFPVHSQIELGEEARLLLADIGMTVGSVVPAGQRVTLRRASNLHLGGDAIDATDDLLPEEVDFVERAARAIPGARLIGMDVLLPRNPGDQGARILEMNSAPLVSMHHYPLEGQPRNVAGAILDAMFAPARPQPSIVRAPPARPRAKRPLRRVLRALRPPTTANGLRFQLLDGRAKLIGPTKRHRSEIIVPESIRGMPVTIIGRGAFKDRADVRTVSIPQSVTTLGAEAFKGCASLTSIELPADLEVINARAFEGCTALRRVHLPQGLRRIAESAFARCASLVMVEPALPFTLEHIGVAAFTGCTSLTAAVIPYRVTRIRSSSFEGCTSLEQITVHAGLQRIDSRAFHGCARLHSVSIPEHTTIGEDAFEGSTSIARSSDLPLPGARP